ncbi:VOC family protein [Streptomyces tateyamensis]|uniref:VOC family protein n=1 Tax=Streptomyces tateyamensis TaxID=565073 RepID=A0A2V4PRM4_9ACTN|nr:VOC family protein [Streptomyces tateyamensis]PYC87625.1 VOC family protein [Streptomyces tateyamensis]
MPDTTLPHPQGAVCWLDMLQSSQDQLLAFYQPLLGWSGEPIEPDVAKYAVQTVGGQAVAGIGYLPPEAPVMPWTGYFAVGQVDAVAPRIEELGGRILVAGMDAPGVGRFAHGTDPGGASFGLWQPGPFPGFEVYGVHGTLAWFELVTTEGKASADFYAALLGAEAQEMPEMPGYWTLHVAGEPRAGIWQVDEVAVNHWRPYFLVDDVDAAVAAAVAGGATVTDPAADSPFGRTAGLLDPVGNEFKLASPPPGT